LKQVDDSYLGSDEYLKLPAQAKMDQVWSKIESTSGSTGKFPSTAGLLGIFAESMEPTFTTPGDAMPKTDLGWPLGKIDRKKFIHTVGTTGKVKFVPSTPGFSGIFKGADIGLVRFSSAAKPVKGGQPLAPGMGLKFFRDGVDSANLVAMFATDGQPGDWNFFSNDFTTIIGPSKAVQLLLLSEKFSSATDFIQVCGLSDMATYTQNGTKESNVEVPFGLRFKPHKDVHTLFPTTLQGDPMDYVQQLQSVPANSNLYEVFAHTGPAETGGKEFSIGTL
jgi:hypothetical protein